MELTPKQQASEAIRQAESILIVTGQRPNIDQVSSVVALAMILRKLGKKVSAMITDSTPQSINFLTQGQIDKTLTGLRDFIMRVDLGRAEVDKLKYTIENGKLNVHVMPFKGGFSPADVSFAHGDYHYDLIVALGVPNRSKLDKFFEQNPTMLQNTPLLNMDYHRINESFGAVNLVDTNSATLAEMLVSLAESLQNGLIDEPIATALLAGIMASTDRFTASHTTPKAMTVAAQLMAAGGKQQQIVKAIFGNQERSADRRPKPSGQFPQSQPSTSRPVSQPQPSVSQSTPEPLTAPQPQPAPEPVAAPEPQIAPEPGQQVQPAEPVHNPLESVPTEAEPDTTNAVGPEPTPAESTGETAPASFHTSYNQA